MSRVAWTVALLMLCGLLGTRAAGTGTERIVRPGEEFQTYPAGASPEERANAAAVAAQQAANQAKEAAEAIKQAIASIPRPPPPGEQSHAIMDMDMMDTLSGDTPVRQAQRHRMGEKARFAQVFGESKRRCKRRKSRRHKKKKRDGPAWNRVTGAAKKYDPNDQMCAICQFLVQRVQLDMAHFNAMGNFLGMQTASTGSASAAAAGQAASKAKDDSNFLELASSANSDAEEGEGMVSAFLQVGQKVTLSSSSGASAAVSGLSWAEQDALEARQLELQAKAELMEKNGDWDALEQVENQRTELKETMRLAAIEAQEEDEVEDEDESEEDSEDEDESDEEDESEDDEEADDEDEDADEQEDDAEEEEEAAPAATSALMETEAVVAQGLTADEQREMEDALQETRTSRIAKAIRKTITDGVKEQAAAKADEGETSFIEKKAGAAGETEVFDMDMLSKEDQDQLLEALDKKTSADLSLTSEERAEMADMMSGEKDQDALDYAAPAYVNGDSEEESEEDAVSDEDLSFIQVSSDVDDEDTMSEALDETESEQIGFDDAADDEHNTVALPVSYRDAPANPHAKRSYARVLHRAELTPTPTIFAETTGQHRHFMSSEGRFGASLHSGSYARSRAGVAKSRKPKHPKGIGLAHSPRRFRLADALYSRPRWNRFDPTVQPHPNPQREQARQMWEKLLHMTYDRLEGYCSTRLPEQFSPFCRPMLRKFRVVAEGLRYGDRPNQICMRTRFCPRGSYVRKSAHNVFKIVPRRRRSV